MSSLRREIERRIYNSNLPKELFGIYLVLWMAATTRRPFGTNVFDHEWDALIVLDACRVDALRSVSPEYGFINSVMEITSLGSTSLEWMLKTFTKEYLDVIEQTRYISTNGHLGHLNGDSTKYFSFSPLSDTRIANIDRLDHLMNRNAVSESNFTAIDRLYNLSERNPYGPTALPDDVTDHAIHVGREHDPDRLIVHYMQPHAPYLKGAIERGYIEDYESSPFEALRNGVSFDVVWNAYLDNLRLVLDSVERLLRNMDAENVIITSDHGDLFGEFGLYSHPAGVFHPDLKRVPWVETEAEDTGKHVPEVENLTESMSDDENMEEYVQDQLEALGYM